jgi:hypothetical protein
VHLLLIRMVDDIEVTIYILGGLELSLSNREGLLRWQVLLNLIEYMQKCVCWNLCSQWKSSKKKKIPRRQGNFFKDKESLNSIKLRWMHFSLYLSHWQSYVLSYILFVTKLIFFSIHLFFVLVFQLYYFLGNGILLIAHFQLPYPMIGM